MIAVLTEVITNSQVGLAAVHKIQGVWLDPHLGVEIGRFKGGFRNQGVEIGLGICKVGGVGSGSNHTP